MIIYVALSKHLEQNIASLLKVFNKVLKESKETKKSPDLEDEIKSSFAFSFGGHFSINNNI